MSEADDIKAAAAASADASSAALSADEKRLKAREAFFDILEREKETHKDIHKKAKEELADMEIAKSMGIERLELAEKRRDVLDKFNAQEQEANKALSRWSDIISLASETISVDEGKRTSCPRRISKKMGNYIFRK